MASVTVLLWVGCIHMTLIAIIASDASMVERARKLFKADHPDIHIEKGLRSEGVTIASSPAAAVRKLSYAAGWRLR